MEVRPRRALAGNPAKPHPEDPAGSGSKSVFCRLRIPMLGEFSCLGSISEEYPDVLFELLSFLPLGPDQFVMSVRVTSAPALPQLLAKWKACGLMNSFEVLTETASSALVNTTQRSPEKSLIRTVVKNRILPTLPLYVRRGVLTGFVVTDRPKLLRFYEQLREVSPKTQIESIRPHSLSNMEGLLTQSQMRIFELARTSGYWDIPHRATLADLAETLDLTTSTVSETLSLVEKKLIEEAAISLPYRSPA